MRIDRIQTFLRNFGLSASGSKLELRKRLEASLDSAFTLDDLVSYLDQVEPWGKQHVILLEAESSVASGWQDADAVRGRLAEAGVEHLLQSAEHPRLPEELTLSAIRYGDGVLEVVAVERRDYIERAEDFDPPDVRVMDGELIEYRAYRHVVTRGLLTFRWRTQTRSAALHISEGFGRYDYGSALTRFGECTQSFLDLTRFIPSDTRRAIAQLHHDEQQGVPEVRSHRVGYLSHGGRSVEATSASTTTSVVGESVVDNALADVAGAANGRMGNFFFQPKVGPTPTENPLTRECHVVILGDQSRVHFMVPSNEETIAYVLQRVRALS